MIDRTQLSELVVEPALREIGLYSDAALELVLNTIYHESRGVYLRQVGGGPALGLAQMEPATYYDIYSNFLMYKPELRKKVNAIASDVNALTYNLKYAAAMCRVHYCRVYAPLPPANDLRAQAAYWKKYYNTPLGKGTMSKFIRDVELSKK